MKAASCNLLEVGARMKEARTALGLSQEGLATAVGGSKRGIQNNEALKSVPGGEVICGLVGLGINANWLLTGEGPMLLADLQAPSAPETPPGALDMERLQLAIEATEEGLAAARRTMQPNKKAELIMAVYDLLEDSGVNKDRVLKLVKLAA